MPPVSLALLWHQHQPYYPDDVSGENLFPWVRLHGTKDYIGMALHLREVPEFRCTINLVPSLLDQIQRYTERGGSDRHLTVSRIPADALSDAEARFMLDSFFMANVDCMIRPYPRYYELLQKRKSGFDPVERALSRFSERDLRDLQVWFNLTWLHPLLFEQDAALRAFRDKGQDWTEADKDWLLSKHLEILARIIPLHKELADSGQVELTTTPYYHPILPLLWDKRAAREAMPACPLPRYVDPYPEDAAAQIRQGVDFHKQLFGAAPLGLWPSEGSVSQDVVSPICEAGIQWIATDEEILAHSTDGFVSRDSQGHVRHPEMLYRPWHVDSKSGSLQIIFRDHGLSDLIGFQYQRHDPVTAAHDLLGRVASIGKAVEPHNAGRPALVPIILDGENCWEYYPDGGVRFLREFYRGAVAHPAILPVRVSDHLAAHPATDRIARLFAGSWISHNFAIWIGHEEDRTAWDLLHETRSFLIERESQKDHPPETLQRARREIEIAEGSDWFWWFGEDHSSSQDSLFDQLFRRHLENVYTLLGEPPPPKLLRPISQAAHRALHTQPRGYLDVHLDGRGTFFEWLNAGRFDAHSERGTMTRVTHGLISRIDFGFNHEHLFVRVDTSGPARTRLATVDDLLIRFVEPSDVTVTVTAFDTPAPIATMRRGQRKGSRTPIGAALGDILEIACPLADLRLNPGDKVSFVIDLIAKRQSVERVPAEGEITLSVPTADYEARMWQA
jgi:alpha-amylase/alpha-mannosidase (GH57 family)